MIIRPPVLDMNFVKKNVFNWKSNAAQGNTFPCSLMIYL